MIALIFSLWLLLVLGIAAWMAVAWFIRTVIALWSLWDSQARPAAYQDDGFLLQDDYPPKPERQP